MFRNNVVVVAVVLMSILAATTSAEPPPLKVAEFPALLEELDREYIPEDPEDETVLVGAGINLDADIGMD